MIPKITVVGGDPVNSCAGGPPGCLSVRLTGANGVSESHAVLRRHFVNSLPREKDEGRIGFMVSVRSAACASALIRGEGGNHSICGLSTHGQIQVMSSIDLYRS